MATRRIRSSSQPGTQDTPGAVLRDSAKALGVSRSALARSLGISVRTFSRWSRGHTRPSNETLVGLARRVAPRSSAVAIRAATLAGVAPTSIGVPLEVASSPVAAALVESVVCTAADALEVTPRVVRPALLAAVRQARAVGLTLDAIEAALEATARPSPPR